MNAFREFLIASNFRPCTVNLIVLSAKRFAEFIESRGLGEHTELPEVIFEDYLNLLTEHLLPQAHIPTYIQQQVWAIGVWTEYLLHTGRLTKCAFRSITRIRAKEKSFRRLNERDIESLFHLARLPEEEVLLLLLAYGFGLRRNEMVELRVGHIHWDTLTISVLHGKGSHHRVVPMSDRLCRLLQLTLAERWNVPHEFVIPRKSNSRACGIRLARLLKELCHKAHIDPPLNLHHLRHHYATHLVERGIGILTVQKFLGHHSPSTTTRYTRKRNSLHSL